MMTMMKKIEELQLNDEVWCADIRSNRLHKLCQTTISDVRDVKTMYTGVRTHLKIAVSDKAEFIMFRDSHYEHSKINVSNTLKGDNWFVIGTDKDELKKWLSEYFESCAKNLNKEKEKRIEELVYIQNKLTEIERSTKRLEKV